MPELPEVQTIVAQLAPKLRGQVLRRLELFDAKLKDLDVGAAEGRVVRRITRLGKRAVFELAAPKSGAGNPVWLSVHLRMTGRLIWSESGATEAGRPPRARLVFDRGSLSFFDMRRFGILRLCRSLDEAAPMGLDPLAGDFTPQALESLLGSSRQEIKPWLMRQDRLSGLGNIYASEILFSARIHPARTGASLTRAEIRRLHAATGRVLRRAIKYCGVTFSDFQDSRGCIGSYQRLLGVYRRAGERCRRCRATIERVVQQQRSTFFCPRCQA